MNRLIVLSPAAISFAVLLQIECPSAQAAKKIDDFSFCAVATHGRCFTLKNEKLRSDSGELKLSQEQLKKVAAEIQNLLSKTAYAIPYKNSGAANCRIGLRYRTETTTVDRCAEKFTADDKARMQRLFQLLSTGAN